MPWFPLHIQVSKTWSGVQNRQEKATVATWGPDLDLWSSPQRTSLCAWGLKGHNRRRPRSPRGRKVKGHTPCVTWVGLCYLRVAPGKSHVLSEVATSSLMTSLHNPLVRITGASLSEVSWEMTEHAASVETGYIVRVSEFLGGSISLVSLLPGCF